MRPAIYRPPKTVEELHSLKLMNTPLKNPKAKKKVPFTVAFVMFWRVWVIGTVQFALLLSFYLTRLFVKRATSFALFPKGLAAKINTPFDAVYTRFSLNKGGVKTINKLDLIELALRNMFFKRSRSMVTIGGMAIGIGAIVFLVSLGFGLQQMVINRVARLEELKQADVRTQPGGRAKINDQTIATIKDFEGVTKALPLIASVAKINYQNSSTDMAVYGVTAEFLKESAIKVTRGRVFEANDLARSVQNEGSVYGISEESPQDAGYTGEVDFSIYEGEWLKVREAPTRTAPIIGYTKRTEGVQKGKRLLAGVYPEAMQQNMVVTKEDVQYAPWIESTFALWEKASCSESDIDCVKGGYKIKRDKTGGQEYKSGYVAQVHIAIQPFTMSKGSVLGLQEDDNEVLSAVTELGDGWVEIASESAALVQQKINKLPLGENAAKQAVVNNAMLKVLGIQEHEAVGKTFTVSYVVAPELLDKTDEKVESVPTDYTIVGVVPEEKTPYFYVPFTDIRSLGVNTYSQLKVVTKSDEVLPKVRRQIEGLGFATKSVADTVKQIESLFRVLRIVLAVVGMVALSIAALGMFNTLTVSLLERTREVGLMKAMGMKSKEVQELFLTESMVMGFFGGVLGIIIGLSGGVLVSLVLSIISLSKGGGLVYIVHLPLGFITFVFFLSLIVGIVTGIYPATRARRISALNALRYE